VLRRADLRGAKLDRGRLFAADLHGASLHGASLKDAQSDARTRWPEGCSPLALGVVIWPDG
jgi:uncharacterized protein YjbI with pentapeptide repeats